MRLDRVALKSGTDISMLVFQTIGTKFRMYMDGIKNPKVGGYVSHVFGTSE